MSDENNVVSEANLIAISPKITEIDFGYHHANDSFVVYPGRS